MLAQQEALAQQRPDSFDFATERSNGWDLKATTQVNWRQPGGLPTVTQIGCRGESPQFSFEMDSAGTLTSLRISFLGSPDEDGEREQITLLGDRLWLYIDGERWEYANIPLPSRQFSNLPYPESKPGEIILIWRGHQAVRRTESEPWRHVSRLYERLIAARKIAWSFKSRNWKDVDSSVPENRLPEGWNRVRYPVDNRGLGDAVTWCERQVASKAAFVLPDTLKAP
ncbi:hypothetical protein OK349_10180 [Sphingomonas sp. BT-65]|uniref:hypothetical protein n=1 Tax=Sphingomonas sp. BT-65 TaxID=2989821 RepID=UPI002235A66C|nr:hypothetical protein [Sphingomonas sp. BT-65]MCW4462074.1 hypothetical protein [Sphingomonas sp. BT-65]